ncbi:MAG: Uma2 family endonuclease [Gemmatimonadota bacterium]
MKMDPKDGASVQAELMTIEEFERLPDDGWQRELVRGHVIKEPPAGFRHSNLGVRLASLLQRFVDDCGLGEVTGADCGFILFDEPPTVRAPDVAFVAGDRLTFDTERFAPLAPDLAVEIVSPSNTVSEIYEKAMNYLQAGTRLVWVVEPRSRSVTVYRSPADIRLLTGEASIDGEDVLPGFRLSLSALFDH